MDDSKAVYWDTLLKIAREVGDNNLIQTMTDVKTSVDDEVIKKIKEGKLVYTIRAASKS
ncbi:hypothetical protein ACFQZ1_23165 [Bacillus sp. CGMCC 1.60114]|uniref:hypothetical protein n=1 Tax=unclassified Bacillus (in: firmicutes) TaxID=185979 RepID=UPI0036317B91